MIDNNFVEGVKPFKLIIYVLNLLKQEFNIYAHSCKNKKAQKQLL